MRWSSLRDALPLAGLALVAGGGTAFFVFARVLFDRVPGFSPHPRYDAGEVVGPLVYLVNGVEIAVGAVILLIALARRADPEVARGPNVALAILGAAILAVALAERFFLLPAVVEVRAQLGRSGFDGDAVSPERRHFGLLHGIDNLAQLAAVLLAWTGLFLERTCVRSRSS
jgi:uncharacterized protein DUF4149